MDDDIKEILDLLVRSLKNKLMSTNVGEISYDAFRNGHVVVNDKFDDLKIGDFLIICKIDFLDNEGIITHEKAEELRSLLMTKISYESEFANLYLDEIRHDRDIDETKKKYGNYLIREINNITDELNRYHLLNNEDDLRNMLVSYLRGNNYPKKKENVLTKEK